MIMITMQGCKKDDKIFWSQIEQRRDNILIK